MGMHAILVQYTISMENIKQVNIKNRTYNFFNGLNNIKRPGFKLTKNRQKIIRKY